MNLWIDGFVELRNLAALLRNYGSRELRNARWAELRNARNYGFMELCCGTKDLGIYGIRELRRRGAGIKGTTNQRNYE